MKNIQDRKERAWQNEPWKEEEVVLYSFIPFFDDEIELGDMRKQTIVRLVKWLLASVNIEVAEFVALTTEDEPRADNTM